MFYRLTAQQFWNRFWRLGRKIESQGGVPTPNDVRLAAILTQYASRSDVAPGGLARDPYRGAIDQMEWVISYGKDRFEANLRATKEARLGA